MAVFRQVQTSFWQDRFIGELTPEEKYFYLYMMTNQRTTQCGVFELNLKVAEVELGYNEETILKLIKRFEDYNKIFYCSDNSEIMLVNWMKYNFINSKNTIICINKEIKRIKSKRFINKLYDICVGYDYPVEKIFEGVSLSGDEDKNSPIEGAYKGLSKEEKEEYKEKEENNEYPKDAVLKAFDKNIYTARIRDVEKIIEWKKKFEDEVIIEAILEAVKYNAKSLGYIDSILKNWDRLSLNTFEKLEKYRTKANKERGSINSDAYNYLDEED